MGILDGIVEWIAEQVMYGLDLINSSVLGALGCDMGGMVKTRNAIEASILGAVIGLPVLHLPFSLTTRIIILCLTALPAVLVSLVGIGGSSLSAFILQLINYLRNRRVLSCDGIVDGSKRKS